MNVIKEERVYDLYKAMKYEPKFMSLGLSEKLHLLERLGTVIIAYDDAGQGEKIKMLSPEMIVDALSERGFNRTRRVLEMCDDLQIKLQEFRLSKDGAELEFKKEYKKKIFRI